MYLNQFSVRIVGVKELANYVKMRDGQRFQMSLRNDWSDPCDAEVSLNGVSVGSFRIHPNSSILLERGLNDDGFFTFFAAGSKGAKQACLEGISPDLRGLVRVVFTPGKYGVHWVPPSPVVIREYHWPHPEPDPPYTLTVTSAACYNNEQWSNTANCVQEDTVHCYNVQTPEHCVREPGEGIVGLSGRSDQHFYGVQPLVYDTSRQTTIFLRLVEDRGGPEEIDARPVTSFSNPIPPPVR